MNYKEFLNFCINQKYKRIKEGIDPTFIVMNEFSFDVISKGLIETIPNRTLPDSKNCTFCGLKILISENLKNYAIKIG